MGADHPVGISRRAFLGAAAASAVAAPFVACAPKTERAVAGGFVDDGGARAHRLRDRAAVPAVRRTERVPLVIVGGGIAGLSAAWRLRKRGFTDFVLLELEDHAGGNARGGKDEISAYPWAAHYVPVPDTGATLVRELFEELGVLRDGTWDERTLVSSPRERIHRWGVWHEGLENALVETTADRDEMLRFRDEMTAMRATGQFTVPSARGARPSPLDGVSMAAWMDARGFRSPGLRWYVDYATRDDYGSRAADTSAWAGIHYFSARPVDDDEHGPLTWPEGNGWITARLLERVGAHVRTGMPVHRVEALGSGMRVLAGDAEFRADAVIWAAPSFLAPHVVQGAPRVRFDYSPWLTANLVLERWPAERGFEPAWDNVIHGSPGLGYVVATHQTYAVQPERTVWTYYHALSDVPPAEARKLLLRRGWAEWKDAILADLERAHPDIRACVSRVDIMRMGHAMVRPTPGFLADPGRRALVDADGPVFYAHSDLSGLSLFEEAQHCGVTAADRAMTRLGRG
ncbi:FAD-dependent oxidoreductase [Longimicrobium terrae]|uniref:Glycine/D-amino acid oxidase-like deaminating enzyme n=1 Tax=Longimicrobium terrae TaxID=1639882 RepID=A0A841H784_9BACT|nr:glycine/D-amino acid oxidase-like deaminating enzyme [Longimicrobium terrae]MBB6073762.1 glycine/D-amino acid oxidase-like deaminating enzyme [Longimicrobium terrae]NNC30255.1 FAD-dependent oxidoreductase [Longimicrobium terrae]